VVSNIEVSEKQTEALWKIAAAAGIARKEFLANLNQIG
jgi:ribonuclease HIII